MNKFKLKGEWAKKAESQMKSILISTASKLSFIHRFRILEYCYNDSFF